MTRTEKFLSELIALPSVNSAFLPARHPHAGEGRVAEFLATSAASAGMDVEFQKVLPGRPNVLARLRPSGKVRQTILLAPHLDTVNVVDESQFKPVKRGGKMFGRGACDTKGSVAAMFTALCDLTKSKTRPRETEIIFVGLVDEEFGQSGSRHLAETKFKADLAIVGEPTRLIAATAHKGSVWLEVQTRGKSAHGATPWFGDNAVHKMASVVDAIETEYAKQLRKIKHPVLGQGSVSVGTIRGGTQTNIVPDQCDIGVDRRILPGETESGTRRSLESFLHGRKLDAKVFNAKLKPCPPMETDATLPLVRAFLRSLGQSRPAGVHYFCDAAVLADGGIPSVVFGPGDIAQAHTADEWISLAQLERGTAMMFQFLKSLP
ncbi:MAG: M20 family metallopeptidase [Verrucomicrobia bacterium]|nr:M20 family metallopeptidase [Verrucomicrobiota bacterium]